jgi:hypothetical protein
MRSSCAADLLPGSLLVGRERFEGWSYETAVKPFRNAGIRLSAARMDRSHPNGPRRKARDDHPGRQNRTIGRKRYGYQTLSSDGRLEVTDQLAHP